MRIVLQRVNSARVDWELAGERGESSIGKGFVLLLGVGPADGPAECRRLADKVLGLRLFPADGRPNNLSLRDVEGRALVISQFTLYGDLSRGRRPSFVGAAAHAAADRLYGLFIEELVAGGIPTATGRFGAHMEVSLVNDGPVTLVLSTDPWETVI